MSSPAPHDKARLLLKDDARNLCHLSDTLPHGTPQSRKSFLVLFFKKEQPFPPALPLYTDPAILYCCDTWSKRSAMPLQAAAYMTEDEFFDFIQTRDEKWELIDGEPMMMAGANQRHQDIAANTLTSLHTQLRGKNCRPTAADTGVPTSNGTIRYPDIVVDCGKRDDQAMRATTPTLVIEVLSPSTRGFDSHKKMIEYKSHPDIKYILLIDTSSACALLHIRNGEAWGEVMYDGLDALIEFPEIGATLALSDVYYGLDVLHAA
jgi:Uma2 family endonuclease